jgi:hypothetical protein
MDVRRQLGKTGSPGLVVDARQVFGDKADDVVFALCLVAAREAGFTREARLIEVQRTAAQILFGQRQE